MPSTRGHRRSPSPPIPTRRAADTPRRNSMPADPGVALCRLQVTTNRRRTCAAGCLLLNPSRGVWFHRLFHNLWHRSWTPFKKIHLHNPCRERCDQVTGCALLHHISGQVRLNVRWVVVALRSLGFVARDGWEIQVYLSRFSGDRWSLSIARDSGPTRNSGHATFAAASYARRHDGRWAAGRQEGTDRVWRCCATRRFGNSSPRALRQRGEAPPISYGVSSYGYDIASAASSRFTPTPRTGQITVDPKSFSPDLFVEVDARGGGRGDHVIIPPNSFALCETVETLTIPRDVLVVCVGKARMAVRADRERDAAGAGMQGRYSGDQQHRDPAPGVRERGSR